MFSDNSLLFIYVQSRSFSNDTEKKSRDETYVCGAFNWRRTDVHLNKTGILYFPLNHLNESLDLIKCRRRQWISISGDDAIAG